MFQGEFDWSTELQGYVLGAGFLSYLITQTPAGRLADAVGAKPLLVFSNALSGLLVIISPFAARWHVYALMAVQFLRGASQVHISFVSISQTLNKSSFNHIHCVLSRLISTISLSSSNI
ncbi:hypothetical protein AVEN_178164-1 [Araneus ventricosus]|uniref:Major facilitator superfamily (MFS) profile domain-containing protein n=1 Tax=Araneus ventricosus TaxID=182803 RepID=A0A4Y1ZW16_ARAVE|nr:hypothetical protein AVEN_178164-1 [Araneus ventricosus]